VVLTRSRAGQRNWQGPAGALERKQEPRRRHPVTGEPSACGV